MQRGERLEVARERSLDTIGRDLGALPGERRVYVEQQREVLGERGAHRGRQDAPATERDGVAGTGVGEQPAHELLLARPKGCLATRLELVCDRVTEMFFEQGVAVERPSTEGGGELGGNSGLAGAHETDQDERHPILSQ